MEKYLYIYVFESGMWAQSKRPPTEMDKMCCEDGLLSIARVKDGVMEHYTTEDAWVKTPDSPIAHDDEGHPYHQSPTDWE